MATIGTFTKTENGYAGVVKTLTVNVKAKIAVAEKDSDKAPDFRIFAGATEFGAAWRKTSKAEREYLSVKLDDPSFPAPIYATLRHRSVSAMRRGPRAVVTTVPATRGKSDSSR